MRSRPGPGNGGRGSVPQPPSPALEAAQRIYERDPARYRKLIVWVHARRKQGWSDDRIHRALRALEAKLSKGEHVEDWWPYLDRALQWIRTRDLQKENDGYKHQAPNQLKVILKKIFSEI